MGAMIFLCRHGNREPDGPEPVWLTPLGREQAERIGEALSCNGIVAVYASPKVRAIETALPLARRLGVMVDVWPVLIEHNSHGPLNYLPAEIAKLGANLDESMLLPDTPKREEKPFAYQRAERALDEIRTRHGDNNVAIFAHDCFNSIFIWSYLGRGCLTEQDRYWQGEGCINVLNDGGFLTVRNEACLEYWP